MRVTQSKFIINKPQKSFKQGDAGFTIYTAFFGKYINQRVWTFNGIKKELSFAFG